MSDEEVKGSLPLGFLAGFLCFLLGLILVLVLAKGQDTKKGALIGFVANIVLSIVYYAVMAMM